MSAISTYLARIKTAIYGEEVRGSIHDAIEQCYDDVTNGKTIAENAASAANTAANNANAKATAANTAANTANQAASQAESRTTDAINAIDPKINDIALVQAAQPSSATNKIWVQPQSDEYQVPTWEEFDAVESALSYYNGMNLVGETTGEYYKIPSLGVGDSFTVSRSDGGTFPSAFRVDLFDANKTRIGYWTVGAGQASRTIMLTAEILNGKTGEYIRYPYAPDVPIMVNYGASVFPYKPYISTIANIFANVGILQSQTDEMQSDVTANGSKIGVIENSVGINLIGTEAGTRYPVKELKDGDKITIARGDKTNFAANFRINFYDKYGNFVTYYSIVAGTYYRTITFANLTSNVFYIGFPNAPDTPLMANYGEYLYPYQPYSGNLDAVSRSIEILAKESMPNAYHITESIGLVSGILYAQKNGIRNVIVEAGTYDIIAEYEALYGADYFTNYKDNYDDGMAGVAGLNGRGIWLQNVNVYFSQGAYVICHYTGDNNLVTLNFSAFATGNNVLIDGLVADTSEIRYTIHPDFETGTELSFLKLKNCDLHNLRTSGENGNRAIGAGFGAHSNWEIEDCIIRSDGANAVFSIHNNGAAGANSKCAIKNCYFDGLGYLDLHPSRTSNKVSVITVSGCCWATDPSITEDAGYKVLQWGNSKRI